MRHLKLEKGADGITVLTLDNTDETMNVASDAWLDEMSQVVEQLRDDPEVTGVVITSGKKAFMAGADLKLLVEGYDSMSVRDAYDLSKKATRMHRSLETLGKPVACAMNGLALGGGFELALACHYRVLADHPKAVVGLPETKWGLLPASGGTQRLGRMVGAKAALELMLSGRSVSPVEALKLGLVDEIAPMTDVVLKAKQWLATKPGATREWDEKGYTIPEARGMIIPEVAAGFSAASASVVNGGGYNLPAPIAITSCLFEGLQLPFDQALSIESKYFAQLLTDPVARNIIRTSFVFRQAAEKGARRPAGYPIGKVEKVGVLGAGMMGSGIALVSAKAGIKVVLVDRTPALAKKGKDYSREVFAKGVRHGKMTVTEMDAILARITPTDDFSLLEDCQLVVEAVFEDVEVKAETTRKAEAVLPGNTIFATNTSTLPITGLSEASVRPDHFIGMHFFSPVDRMGLVEVIRGRHTSDETLARSIDFISQLHKTPIVVNDSRGFYTSRVFQMLVFEGAAMLSDGVEPARIENAARSAGFPVGPLALLDEVTIDLPVKIAEQAIADGDASYVPEDSMPVLRKMLELGRSSRKSGGAFYEYPKVGSKHLWKGLTEYFPPAKEQPDQEELKRRFFYIQALEAARCLEEGVLETPQDADLGAVYGWGFPLWTGGTLSYIDTVGIAEFVRESERLAVRYGSRFTPSKWLCGKADRGEAFYSSATFGRKNKSCVG